MNGLASAAVAIGIIWASFGFRYSADPRPDHPGAFMVSWEHVLLQADTEPSFDLADGSPNTHEVINLSPGPVSHLVEFFRGHRLLPEAYLYGLALVDRYSRSRLAYFNGDYRNTGWFSFFPVAFAIKTTLPALGLTFAGFLCLVQLARSGRFQKIYGLTPLLVLIIVYGSYSLLSHLAIGQRHLLPLYPVLFILAGAVAHELPRHRKRLLIGALTATILLHAFASLRIRPSYLAYFNVLMGGPSQGHRVFVDSSLDWGQDLPGLKTWLNQNTTENDSVFLSYFGSADPRYHGIHATRFGDGYFNYAPRAGIPELTGGTYAISATMLHRVYTPVRGPWTAGFESTYQELGSWLRELASAEDAPSRVAAERARLSPAAFEDRLQTYEALQFGRLCHYLTNREPDDSIGFSILIFQLTDEEVGTALYAPLAVLNDLIVRRVP